MERAADLAPVISELRKSGVTSLSGIAAAKQGKSGLGLEAYLDGGHWRIAAEFTEIESGRRSDRPQLEAALKAARARRCPLVVAKVDRLTRSVAFLSRLLAAATIAVST